MKKKIFNIELKPFRQDCLVVINGEFKDAYKFIKKLKSEGAKENIKTIDKEYDKYVEVSETSQGCVYTQLPYGFIMLITKNKNNWINTVGVTVHECTHLVQHCLKRVGVTLSDDSEETYTYLVQDIVEQVLSKIY